MTDERARARQLAAAGAAAGRPLEWFEQLYAEVAAGQGVVPWADFDVNPHLAAWGGLDPPAMRRVLVTGCGYGDDAQWLAAHGCEVTAFDISPTAVATARARFPGSPVDYRAADLLDMPAAWRDEPFDLVVDAYTVQVLPPGSPQRAAAVRALASVTGGTLLIIARGRDAADPPGSMPWPLLAAELAPLTAALGLREVLFEDYLDGETPPARRFRVTYNRPPA